MPAFALRAAADKPTMLSFACGLRRDSPRCPASPCGLRRDRPTMLSFALRAAARQAHDAQRVLRVAARQASRSAVTVPAATEGGRVVEVGWRRLWPPLFVAQRFDRLEPRGVERRVQAEGHAD